MIQHVIQAEVVPLVFRQQRVNLDGMVLTWTQATEARDDKVVPRRVVVITRTLLVPLQPITSCLVKVFANIGLASHVLTLHVLFYFSEIQGISNDRIAVVIQIVGHSGQRLTGGKGPYGTIPLTFTYTMCAELRMTTLGGRLSIGSGETLWVTSLKPCDTVFRFVLGHVGVPRHVANGFTNVSTGVDAVGLEKRMLLVP